MVCNDFEEVMRRFFFEFDPQETLILAGEQFVHLAFVLRSEIGEKIVLCRNDDYDYVYEITDITKKFAELRYIEKNKNNCNPTVYVKLFPALEKGDKLELVVQKAVELGISEIIPLKTEFCQVKSNSIRIDRLQKIANEACKQCGRSRTAHIGTVITLNELNVNKPGEITCFLYEGDCRVSLSDFLNNIDKISVKSINIIIGSEGGFSDKEVKLLISKGIVPLTMGKRILRAETACISASAIVMAEMGELQ